MDLLSAVVSLLSAVVGAVVGGVLTARAAKWTLERTSRDLEATEVRRLKVECLTTLSGLRFVMTLGAQPPDEFKARMAFELNRVLLLWADDAEVVKDFRDFYGERTNERFIKLIKALGRTTKLPMEHLSDADLRGIFSMTFSR